ncbi:hypothetical protein SAMN05216544_2291 [Lachnospira pectinoschiza]|uniref:Uncharacterized protein n=1 Tax=Lachnospira pectinoschiza TaxID=28052 RepID=A0A1G9ZZA9_9FIRM|nr:hypothetical protein SAMN05216544_2291 [Lachnospira pectinoschiza]
MEIYNFKICYCEVQDEIWYSLSKFVICSFIMALDYNCELSSKLLLYEFCL